MARSRCTNAKSKRKARTGTFKSLTWALDRRFDKKLAELPATIRKRVEKAFHPVPWDAQSREQRQYQARRWDYEHDPVNEHERQQWWELSRRYIELEVQIRNHPVQTLVPGF